MSRTKAQIIESPIQGEVIQLRSDFWIIFDDSLWREMTVQEQIDYD